MTISDPSRIPPSDLVLHVLGLQGLTYVDASLPYPGILYLLSRQLVLRRETRVSQPLVG